MDAQKVISSGIIELYVAGMATEPEVRELEAAMIQFPEVLAAVEEYRKSLEYYVAAQDLTPDNAIKASLLNQINNLEANGTEQTVLSSTMPQHPKATLMEETLTEEKRLSWKVVAAAAFVLLIGSVIMNFFYYKKWKDFRDYKDKYQALMLSQNSIQSTNDKYKARLDELEQTLNVMEDPAVLKVNMPGTKLKPDAVATVFWNTQNKQVYLKVNNLPEPAADKQYQLWAIVDGKPIDMGVFEMGDTAKLLQKMKVTDKVQMFAVTLESKGGAAQPTLEQMYVAGKLPG
ncbi:anti-sigma factor [Chitinophaga sp. sic0106]|uniref:anti-sigma factor n=1 Tax=Chitinophaga sp. sic0106 TaxID=2854785 RepID=UPI001C473B17|nr:anti-sigma factor [Chitinophaga sp. sic0106]